MRTIAIINQKGGCGKTTTAINLSGMLAHRGLRVLLVDLDPQSHCAAGLGVPETRLDLDIGDAMLATPARGVDPSRLIWRVGKNMDLAPSRMRLAGLEAARGGLADKSDRDRRLAMVLGKLSGHYDVAIVDCSPSIGLLTFNALAAAEMVIIPVETSFFSLQGATKQFNTIQSLSRRLNHNAEIWLLPTIHVPENSLARDLLDEVLRRFGDHVAPMVIRRDPSLSEAATFGKPVIEHAPESPGSQDYLALAEWVAARVEAAEALRAVAPPETVMAGPMGVEADLLHAVRRGELGDFAAPRVPAPMDRVQSAIGGPAAAEVSATGAPVGPAASQGGSPASPGSPAAAQAGSAPEAPRRGDGLLRSRADDLAALAARMRRELMQTTSQPQPVSTPGPLPGPLSAPAVVEPAQARGTVVVEVDPPPARLTASVQRLLGARETAQGVLFVQPAGIGRRVAVAGEFNGWSADSHVLRLNAELGILELCVSLPAGRHRYRLIVDGRWCPDPYNEQYEANPVGGFDSMVDVAREACVTAGGGPR